MKLKQLLPVLFLIACLLLRTSTSSLVFTTADTLSTPTLSTVFIQNPTLGPTNEMLMGGNHEFLGSDGVTQCRLCQIDCIGSFSENFWSSSARNSVTGSSCQFRYFNYGCTRDFYCISPSDFSVEEKIVIAGLCMRFNGCQMNPRLKINSGQRLISFLHTDLFKVDRQQFMYEQIAYYTGVITKLVQTSADNQDVMCATLRPHILSFVHPGPAALLRLRQTFDILSMSPQKALEYVRAYERQLPQWFIHSFHIINSKEEIKYILSGQTPEQLNKRLEKTVKNIHAFKKDDFRSPDLFLFLQCNKMTNGLCSSWFKRRNNMNTEQLSRQIMSDLLSLRNSINADYYRSRITKCSTLGRMITFKRFQYQRECHDNLSKQWQTRLETQRFGIIMYHSFNRLIRNKQQSFFMISGTSNKWIEAPNLLGTIYTVVRTREMLDKYKIPRNKKINYYTSITGKASHYRLMGITSVYPEFDTKGEQVGFRVYISYNDIIKTPSGRLKPHHARSKGWVLNWIGILDDQKQETAVNHFGALNQWNGDSQNIQSTVNTGLKGQQYIITSLEAPLVAKVNDPSTGHNLVIGASTIKRTSKDSHFIVQLSRSPTTDDKTEQLGKTNDPSRESGSFSLRKHANSYRWRLNYLAARIDDNRILMGTSTTWNLWLFRHQGRMQASGIYTDVNLSQYNLPSDIRIITTLEGREHQHLVSGASSIYRIPGKKWNQGFRVYLCFSGSLLKDEHFRKLGKIYPTLLDNRQWTLDIPVQNGWKLNYIIVRP